MEKRTIYRIYGWSLIWTFCVGITLPLVFLKNESVSALENRYLSQRPTLWDFDRSLSENIEIREAYFNEQYGFRDEMIRTGNKWLRSLGVGAKESVIVGQDGWLFYAGGESEDSLSDHLGLVSFSDKELERWRKHLESKRDRLREKGIEYVFAIAPGKMEIYGEYLPKRYGERVGPTRCEQLVAYMSERSDVPIIYMRDSILAIEWDGVGYELFDKGGTHWNQAGIGLAQNGLATWLGGVFPGLDIDLYSKGDFIVGESNADTDLARMLGLEDRYASRGPILASGPLGVTTAIGDENRFGLKGARSVELMTSGLSSERRAILFGDSFSAGLGPFLAGYFGEVAWIWKQPSVDETLRAVDRYPVDVVIEQRVQRLLGVAPVD